MEKAFNILIGISLFLIPLGVYAQSDQMPPGVPPVAQPLIREGDFAVKLAEALKIGPVKNEVEAETMLGSSGILPKNGWIADYPVTPDMIGELQSAVGAAADAQKLPMGKKEALQALQDVTAEFGLAVVPGSSGRYAENQPQPNSTVINNYYYEEGPPVITYYPPPWDYYYLYAWVPYPFWWGGFFFSGFYSLHDFHRVVVVGHRRCVVTNHFSDRNTNRVFAIDPARRRTGETFRTGDVSHNRGFKSNEGRRGAASILERSSGRVSSLNGRNATMTNNAGRDRSTLGGRNEMSLRGPSTREGRSSNGPIAISGRSFSSSSTGSRSLKSSESSGRSFSTPNRSFSGSSSKDSGFSCTNCHGKRSSFGGNGGSSSRSFSSAGFSGGRSSESFSGGGSSRGGGFSGGRGGGGGRGR